MSLAPAPRDPHNSPSMLAVEESPLGRIVLPDGVPEGRALFYTSGDISGRLNHDAARALTDFVQSRFGLRTSLATCTQVHGATAVHAVPSDAWRENASCDAIWSDRQGISLAIKVADCLPVTFIDDVHDVIANIHSGWRGTVQRITAATLDTLLASSKFDVRSASVWLGPSIRQCCFEVGEEVVTQLEAAYGDISAFVDRSRAKAHVDTVGITIGLLREYGFTDSQVIDTRLCTRCPDSLFHSYRRDAGSGGRNLAIVAQ